MNANGDIIKNAQQADLLQVSACLENYGCLFMIVRKTNTMGE